MDKMKRITYDPEVLAGKAIIRGTRISVELVLEMLSKGASIEKILKDYPSLEKEDVLAAIDYALKTIRFETTITHGELKKAVA